MRTQPKLGPKTRLARHFRKNPTAKEEVLWECLRNDQLGFRFRRQHVIGGFVLDFYCPAARLCVEIDGVMHDAARDKRRDAELMRRNIETIRIPEASLDVNTIAGWVQLIRSRCNERIV